MPPPHLQSQHKSHLFDHDMAEEKEEKDLK